MNLALLDITDPQLLDFSTVYSSNILQCTSAKQMIKYCKELPLDGLIINAASDWKKVLEKLQEQGSTLTPPIFLWGKRRPKVSNLLEMGRLGVEDYLYKVIEKDYLLKKIKENSYRQILQLKHSGISENSIDNSLEVSALKVANSNHNLLLTGETGCGKSYYAKWIHNNSNRSKKEFISINCASLARGIFESELFGSAKGAYTDAVDRPGLLELSQGGTLFFDEVSELTVHQQAKLLSVLEDREFRRVGSTKVIKLKARIIFATNKKLKKDIKKGRFREDFYYRINALYLKIPPLRKRREEIPRLISLFLKDLNSSKPVSARAIKLLINYHWPGNIRQLYYTLLRADTNCGSEPTIDSHHISFD